MKYLFISNDTRHPSGYGQQTAIFTPRIKASGRNIAIFAFAGSTSTPTTWNDILVLPRLAHPYGNDVVLEHFRQTKSNIAITLVDPHVLDAEAYGSIPWCAWAPLDCEPIYLGTLAALKKARWIWAMSRFGEKQLQDAGLGDKTVYVPHGIDSTIFRPMDRHAARQSLAKTTGADINGKFLIAMVGANRWAPARKGFFEGFSAFKTFSDSHPKAMLYVHSEMSNAFGGEELIGIAALVGLDSSKITFAPQYHLLTGILPPSYMASVYNAADVYLSASHTEGFGLPSLESQMCGCPVILPDNSAQTEMCMTGRLVETIPYMSLGHVVWKRPKIDALVDVLEWAYEHWRDTELRGRARERAMVYDSDVVFEKYMKPALQKMEVDLK